MPTREIDTTIPEGYAELLAAAKDRVRRARISAARRVNSEVVLMYLEVGQLILDRQADEGWGPGSSTTWRRTWPWRFPASAASPNAT